MKKREQQYPIHIGRTPKDIVRKYIGVEQFRKVLFAALDEINNDPLFRRQMIFQEENGVKSTWFGGFYESGILYHLSEAFPEFEFHHPSNDCELGDVYSHVLNSGIEIKTCQGIGKTDATVWYNGKIKEDKYEKYWKYFLFIRTKYENCKMVIKEAWYGYLPYKVWNRNQKTLSIGTTVVEHYCERII